MIPLVERMTMAETNKFAARTKELADRVTAAARRLNQELEALNAKDDPDQPWPSAVRARKVAAIRDPIEREIGPLAVELRQIGDLIDSQKDHHTRGARLLRASVSAEATPGLIQRVAGAGDADLVNLSRLAVAESNAALGALVLAERNKRTMVEDFRTQIDAATRRLIVPIEQGLVDGLTAGREMAYKGRLTWLDVKRSQETHVEKLELARRLAEPIAELHPRNAT